MPASRNLVASHLYKYVNWMQDVEGWRIELAYVRDREGHEVDFLLLQNRKPWVLIEAKLSAAAPDPSLAYFRSRLGVDLAFQVTAGREAGRDMVPAVRFLAGLP